MDGHHMPDKTIFYMVVVGTNLDRSVDLEAEKPSYFATLDDACAYAKDEAKGYSLEARVYECTPVRIATRGPLKILPVKAKRFPVDRNSHG
jgi:hypothetical protein